LIGLTISHCRILAKIGEGGMGAVYRAMDLTLGREIALKFLPPDTSADPHARKRLRREAQAASRLNHPSIAGETQETLVTSGTTQNNAGGTISYMSPEQLCGARASARSDIFSFIKCAVRAWNLRAKCSPVRSSLIQPTHAHMPA
jgi:serine/threonine protein kinase